MAQCETWEGEIGGALKAHNRHSREQEVTDRCVLQDEYQENRI